MVVDLLLEPLCRSILGEHVNEMTIAREDSLFSSNVLELTDLVTCFVVHSINRFFDNGGLIHFLEVAVLEVTWYLARHGFSVDRPKSHRANNIELLLYVQLGGEEELAEVIDIIVIEVLFVGYDYLLEGVEVFGP